MYSFQTFKKLVTEAIPLRTAIQQLKPFYKDHKFETAAFVNSSINKTFEELAAPQKNGGKYRIYLTDVKFSVKLEDSPFYKAIVRFLRTHNLLHADYVQGTVKDERGNTLKIGKVLNKIAQSEDAYNFLAKKYYEGFVEDPIRQIKEGYIIVISRHPYDLLGVSTDRNWTSCMDLRTPGIHYKHKKRTYKDESLATVLTQDIEHSVLVAYLIAPNDRNITHPISRVTIKPYFTDDGSTLFHTSNVVYGVKSDQFRNFVNDWVNKHINHNVTGGMYSHDEELYREPDDPVNYRFMSKDQRLKQAVLLSKVPSVQNVLVGTLEDQLSDVLFQKPIKDLLSTIIAANGKANILISETTENTMYLSFAGFEFKGYTGDLRNIGANVSFVDCEFEDCMMPIRYGNNNFTRCMFFNSTVFTNYINRDPFVEEFRRNNNMLKNGSRIAIG